MPGTSTQTTRLVLHLVAEQAGPEGVRRVLDRAGLADRYALLRSVGGRVPYAEKIRLFEAAVIELDDPRLGLRLGPTALWDPAAMPLRMLARAFGSPAALVRGVSRLSTRFDTASVMRCVRVRAGEAIVSRKVLPPHWGNRVDCDYVIGVLAQIPVVFGFPPARIDHHTTCQLDGAPECIYHLAWSEPPIGRVRNFARRFTGAERGRHSTARHRLAVLEGAASELVSNAPLEELLDRIAARADLAVHAPGHLLVVRLPAGGRHVRARGTGEVLVAALDDDGAAPNLSGTNWSAVTLAGSPVLCVPVASATYEYGVLAAVAHPGQEFFPEDREALATYARHAAAVLDSAGLLAEARENAETSTLLLDVARALAEGSTLKAVATAVAEAVPLLSGAPRSAVALWNALTGRLVIAGMSGWYGEGAGKLAEYVTTDQESPELAQLLSSGAPVLVTRRGSDWAKHLLADFDLCALAAIPITSGDQISGLLLVHWPDEPAPENLEGALVERLTGLACLAAVALENIRLLEEAQRLALHDPLTGLPNRALLEDRLETALAQAEQDGRKVGLVFCDVNRFKRINDSLGHGAGDCVLRHIATQLQTAVRSGDTVARYSGDEFVILLPDLGAASEVDDLAARIRASLTEAVDINGTNIFVDVAIGTSVSGSIPYVRTDAQSAAARLLVEDADVQMYRAKALRRGHRPPSARRDTLKLETDLHGAVRRGELRVYYQPQIDVITETIVAVEALVRWEHPELGLILPGDFIPLAEDSDLITDIGAYVLTEACQIGAGLRAAGHDIEISVNISAVQLDGAEFTALVRDIVERTGFPAASLTLEVTESQAVSETIMIDSTLRGLRTLGVGVSVDDFGTGYSSLAQLHRLPVTEIKIDRSFTARLPEEGPAFIAGIVGLGHGLGLRVVAEGVETWEQLQLIRAVGCERAQGYLFGEPVSLTALEKMLRTPTTEPSGGAVMGTARSRPRPGVLEQPVQR
jgi:diguanylate cyclase (GGDEF)-like protein